MLQQNSASYMAKNSSLYKMEMFPASFVNTSWITVTIIVMFQDRPTIICFQGSIAHMKIWVGHSSFHEYGNETPLQSNDTY